MNFLSIAALTIAAWNTARLEFSDITLTSEDPVLCNTIACHQVVSSVSGTSELFSKAEFRACLSSVSVACRYNATVYLSGELNEFCAHDTLSNYIMNVTDITLKWGSVDRDTEVRGSVVLSFEDFLKKTCRVTAGGQTFPMKCEPASISRGPHEIFMTDLKAKSNTTVYLSAEVFALGAHEYTHDGLMLALNGYRDDCGQKLISINFYGVTWRANFSGFAASPAIISAAAIPFVAAIFY